MSALFLCFFFCCSLVVPVLKANSPDSVHKPQEKRRGQIYYAGKHTCSVVLACFKCGTEITVFCRHITSQYITPTRTDLSSFLHNMTAPIQTSTFFFGVCVCMCVCIGYGNCLPLGSSSKAESLISVTETCVLKKKKKKISDRPRIESATLSVVL